VKLLSVLLVRLTSLPINPVTLSLNVAVTKNGAFVVAGDADVKVTVGARVSITMALLPPRELTEAVLGRVKVASKAVPKVSLIVPPLRVRALVARYCKSAEESPGCTT
jgi:hypothetical protein